jgi:hypothetical protein
MSVTLSKPTPDLATGRLITRARAHERARVRVAHAIRHALERLATHNAVLNEHLRATIKTGKYCVYRPDPRRVVRWNF